MPLQTSTDIGPGHVPLRIAVWYALFGLLWIWLSDWVLNGHGFAAKHAFLASAMKGTVFVVLTSILLYWLVRREVTASTRSENLLRAVVDSTTHAVLVKDRDSEKRYRELANAIPQIVWTAGLDGAITHVNSKAVEYTGVDAADLAGWSWQRVIHPDDQAHAVSEWSLALVDGVPRTFEMRIRRADGEYRWHIVRELPVCDSAGAIESWVGTCTDIDELTRARGVLHETETRLREAQRIARLGSWSWEPPTNRVWWSDAEYELFAADPLRVQPSFESFLEILHPDDRAIAVQRVESMKAGADEIADNLRVILPDGECIWIHSRARATRNAEGRLERVEGTDQDVTEIVRARQQLIAERDRFEKVMEAVPVAICSFEAAPDGRITMPYASPRIEAIYGISPAALVQDASGVFSTIHPDDVERVKTSIAESSNSMTLWRDEYRVLSPVLGEIWVEGCSSPIRRSDGSMLWHGYVNDVTARRRTDDAMRASERRLRLALESAASVAFTWDIRNDTVTRYFSTEAGLPVTEETSGTLDEVRDQVHPDDLSGFDSCLASFLSEGGDYRNSYRILRPDGTTASLEEYGYLDRAADGSPLCITGISVDVTEREAANEALRMSEARYRQLVDLLPAGIFVFAGDKVLYGNPAFLRMIGAKGPEDLLGSSPLDIAHPSAHEAIHRRNTVMTQTGGPVPGFIDQVIRRDGRSVPVYSVAAPITGYGQPATLVAVTDLTERERANQLLRSVLSSVGEAIITIDKRGVIGSTNPAAMRLFGYTEEEMIGRNVSVLMPEPYSKEHDGYLASYLRTGVAKMIGTGREVECRRRDGSLFPADLTVTEFTLDGELKYTGVLRDITERQRLQSQFIQAQKMEAIGRLAGGVAHDFNNLLTIIAGYCDVLMADIPAGHSGRESIAVIRDAGERAARLTQQLLAFSRKAVIEPKLINLNELVSDSARLLRRLIGEDIILAVVTAPKAVFIKADPGHIEQVIMNLVVNARDAMPTGGRLTIETSIVSPTEAFLPSFACLSVSDTGHGMSDEVQEKLFEPFFTTRGVGKGTGLGLAVVHGVVSQSGGKISIESSVGNGTTFRIQLPLITAPTSDQAVDTIRFPIRGSETVLLVEDDEAVRRITRISLQLQGYTVLEADGGTAALQIAQKHAGDIHIMVSDVVMPEMGGRQLLDAVRQYRPDLRVLFMSGYTDDAVLLHGVVEATDAFIQKPFTPLGLVRKVREVIDVSVR